MTLELQLLLAFVGTIFLTLASLWYWGNAYQQRQTQSGRMYEVGATREFLAATQARGSFLMRFGDTYDRSPAGLRLSQKLLRADLKLKPAEFQLIIFMVAVIAFYIIFQILKLSSLLAFVISWLITLLLPRFIFALRRDKYIEVFNRQLIEVTDLMASSLRAGLSVPQAVNVVAQKVPAPAGIEFITLSRELRLGTSFEQAMVDMQERVPSKDLEVVVTTILIQRQVGGNLARALTELAHAMHERNRVNNEVQTMTAEVRYSSNIMIILPFLALMFMRLTMPGFTDAIFTNPIGWLILALVFGVQVAAYFIIRKISDIKV